MMNENFEELKKDRSYKRLIVPSLAILAILILIAGILYKKTNWAQQVMESPDQQVSTAEPIDIVLDFYEPWLKAVRSTSTNPYTSGLATHTLLSESLRAQLISTEGHPDTEIDPVLCQTTIPQQVKARVVYQREDTASVLITAKEQELTAQSVFTLKRKNDGWFIDSITCSPGEFETPREFSFEKEGYLLKNVPSPLDPQYWHIVFEQNGELGHAAPLFFDTETVCKTPDAQERVCDTNAFTEAAKVHVYGQMTELGVDVTRLEFIE